MLIKRYAWFLVAAAIVLSACAQKVIVAPAPTPAVVEKPAPPSADHLLSEAEKHFEKKDYIGAVNAFDAFIGAYPDHDMVPAALMKIGAAYRVLGDYVRSRKAYETVIQDYPGSYFFQEAWVEILATYYYEGRFDAVITKLDTALAAITQGDLRLRVNLLSGDAYMALDAPSEAVLAYVRAYQQADDRVRSDLKQRLSSALRLLDKDAFDALLLQITNPAMVQMIADLGRSLIYRRTTIGCLLPLSGAYQIFGQRAQTGIELALAEAASRYPTVALLVRDTGGDDERAAAAVRELAEAGVAAIVGPIATADTAAGEAQSLGIPIITLTQREGVAGRGDFVFRNFITPQMQTEALVTHAVNTMGARRFAILYPKDNYGTVFMNLFWDEILHQGATVAAVAAYDGDQTDFAEAIKKTVGLEPLPSAELSQALRPILPTTPDRLPFADYGGNLIGLYFPLPDDFYPPPPDPADAMAPSLLWETAMRQEAAEPAAIVDFDAVFIPDAPRTAGLLIPQLAYFDISGPVLLGTNLWHSDELVKMSRNYVQGAIFPDGFFSGSQRPSVRRFVAAYASIYGETPGFIEAISYDSTKLLLETVTRSSVRSRTGIRDALLKTADFQGATGTTAFDYNGEARKKPFLLTIRGRRLEEIATARLTGDDARVEEHQPDATPQEVPPQ